MSEFDKEAERERLREKYERDEAKREATEKMSELLLQGATMTNAHCSDCGDPIFRYDGQEFCATCEQAVDRNGEAAEDGSDLEVTDPDTDTNVQFGAPESTDESDATPADTADSDQDDGWSASEVANQPSRESPVETTSDSLPSDTPTVDGDGSLEGTRASLKRQLASLTSQAETVEDPRDAEAYLAAARTAAETLAALRR